MPWIILATYRFCMLIFHDHPNRTTVASPTLLYLSGTQVRIMIWHFFPALARTAPINLSRSGSLYPKASSKMREAPLSFETVIAHAKRDIREICSLVPPLKDSNGTLEPSIARLVTDRSSVSSTSKELLNTKRTSVFSFCAASRFFFTVRKEPFAVSASALTRSGSLSRRSVSADFTFSSSVWTILVDFESPDSRSSSEVIFRDGQFTEQFLTH